MSQLSVKRPTKNKRTSTLDDLKAEIQGDTNEPKKRINVDVPESFHLEAFIYAKKTKTNLTGLVTKALREYMSKHPLQQ